ncbi:Diphthamide biosynthesis protein 3 [Savitreella phatthalungensis]
MSDNFYDEIEIEDMTFDKENGLYHYPCPCGDRFEITIAQLAGGDDVARCPSCSLIILVIYDQDEFEEQQQAADARG